tara:strand:+ start:494 stop:679 length:186 start_codon:yes stop_codon:yes gene_type:complete
MEDNRIVTSAKYQQGFIGSENVNIVATIDGQTVYVPLNADNTDYQAIQDWVAQGNTIQEAD